MVVDFRALNEKMSAMRIHPNIIHRNIESAWEQILQRFLIWPQVFTKCMSQMYKSDAPKQLFTTPYEHYQFKRMLFDLKNIPATFLMDQVLSGLQEIELFVYLNDIVLYVSSLHEHELKFNKLTDRLRKENLKARQMQVSRSHTWAI